MHHRARALLSSLMMSPTGLYPACTHRVVIPDKSTTHSCTVNGTSSTEAVSARYSVVYFSMVDEDAVVTPLASQVEKAGAAKFERTT